MDSTVYGQVNEGCIDVYPCPTQASVCCVFATAPNYYFQFDTWHPFIFFSLIYRSLPYFTHSHPMLQPFHTVKDNSVKVGSDDEVTESNLWRLYGASPVSLNNGNFSSNRPGRKWLFPSTLGDSDVQGLVKGLNNLPVSCQDHHQSKQPTLEQKYGQFLAALARYAKFHKQERTKDTARLLIWTCDPKDMCGGLGDRLRGVTYVLVLAMSSQRVLLLDWSDSSFSKVTYVRPNMINWQLTPPEQKLVFLESNSVKKFNLGRRGNTPFSANETQTNRGWRMEMDSCEMQQFTKESCVW